MADAPLVVPVSSVPPTSPATGTKVSLTNELLTALDRALLAGMGAFVGAMTLATTSDTKSLAAAGVAAGSAALISLGNSVRTFST